MHDWKYYCLVKMARTIRHIEANKPNCILWARWTAVPSNGPYTWRWSIRDECFHGYRFVLLRWNWPNNLAKFASLLENKIVLMEVAKASIVAYFPGRGGVSLAEVKINLKG